MLILGSLLMLLNQWATAQNKLKMDDEKKAESLDMEGNLTILNLWGEQPAYIQNIYRESYKILSAGKNSSYIDLSKNDKLVQLCHINGVDHWGGPMIGNISSHGASIWLRTIQPSRVEVKVFIDGIEKSFGPFYSTDKTDLSAVVQIDGLQPATNYPCHVLINGKPLDSPCPISITTGPEENSPSKVRIAFGTCPHRWGLGNQKLMDQIRDRKPLALLLGGDIAVQDRLNHAGLHRADYLLRDFYPAWQSLVASIPVYATWDDHDYFGNDLSGIPDGFTARDKETVWEVFRYAWNNPSYGFGDNGKGIFFRTRIGSADIIMLDNRYFRTGKKGTFLGKEQMEWLEKQLLDCKGPFIILSCGTMWSDYVSNGKDSWGTYDPEGREAILNLIKKNKIKGVLLISGDRHGARGFRIPRPSGYSFYEFEAASLGGRRGPAVTKSEWKTQLYGIEGKYAFGEFAIDATLEDPKVTFRLIQDDGTTLYQLTLKRSQLSP